MPQPPPSTPLPLQLEEYFLNRLNVEWRNSTIEVEHRPTSLKVQVDYDFAQHAENPHAYQMTLSVKGQDVSEKAPEAGYKFDAVIVGRYRIENAKTPDGETRLARVNGVSLLYSTLRGILGGVTGNFEFGKLTLPSINPVGIVDQVEKAKAPAPKTESTAPIPPIEMPVSAQ